jgi:hypothetical protein
MNNIVAGLAATLLLRCRYVIALCFFFFNMCFVLLPRTIVVYWWYSRILITTLKVRAASIHSKQTLLPFHITLEISNISNFKYQTFWSKLNKLFKKRKPPIKDFEWSWYLFSKWNDLTIKNYETTILSFSSNPERHSYQS